METFSPIMIGTHAMVNGIRQKRAGLFFRRLIPVLPAAILLLGSSQGKAMITTSRPPGGNHPVFFDLRVKSGTTELLILFNNENPFYRHYILKDPPRLVIDIPDSSLPEKRLSVPGNGSGFLGLRASEDKNRVRFVLDLAPGMERNFCVGNSTRGIRVLLDNHRSPVCSGESGGLRNSSRLAALATGRTVQPLNDEMLDNLLGKQKITILFHNVPLVHFFTYVTEKSGVEFRLADLRAKPLTRQFTETPLAKAVSLVIADMGLRLSLVDGDVVVSNGASPP